MGLPSVLAVPGRVQHQSATTEPRQDGITELLICFDTSPGFSMSAAIVGNHCLDLTFTPGLANGQTYQVLIGSDVTSIGGQSIEIRGLLGDVNSDGRVNGADRSSVVVDAWTGGASTSCAP